MPKSEIELDDYEAVNLLSVLRASGVSDCYMGEQMPQPNPLEVLNSGDWIGQIIRKLEKRLDMLPDQSVSTFHSKHFGIMWPNKSPQEYVVTALAKVPHANKG